MRSAAAPSHGAEARPLTIALVIETGGPGGAEQVTLQLACALRDRGHRVCPIGPDNRSDWLATRFRDLSFEPEVVSPRRSADPGVVRDLMAIIKRRAVDVVHSHEFDMAVHGALASRLARRPHVITMHGGRYYAGRWARRRALGWAARRSQAVVGVSASVVADLERTLGLQKGTVHLVHNGIRFEEGHGERVRSEVGVRVGETLVAAVGSLYPVKGHIVLLRALRRLDLHATPWRLVVAGRGGEETALRAYATAEKLADRVHLLGHRSDVSDVLAAADIFAMPSLSEGLPLGLLEAMFAGKPTVASDVGGIPEAVTSGRDALLVPPGNEEALAAAIRALIVDPALRGRLATAARERATSAFGVDRMADAYVRLYTAAQLRT